MLNNSISPRRPKSSYWRTVFGDGEIGASEEGRSFLRKREAWRRSSTKVPGQSTYKWKGRSITIVASSSSSRGNGLNAVRQLNKPAEKTLSAPLSPLKIEEPSTTASAPPTTTSQNEGFCSPHAVPAPFAPPPPPTPKPLSPIKTNLESDTAPTSNGLLYTDKPIRLHLLPGTASIELHEHNGIMVVKSVMEELQSEPDHEPIMPKNVEYAFGSTSFPSSADQTHSAFFTHREQQNVSETLRGSTTCYATFQDGVKNFPNNNCLGSILQDPAVSDTPSISYQTYAEVQKSVRNLSSHLTSLDLTPPDDDGLRLLGIFMSNSADWIVAEQAAYSNNAAVVPLYSTLGPQAISFILKQTNLKTVVCSFKELPHLTNAKNEDPSIALSHIILSSRPVNPSDLPNTPNLTIHSLADYKFSGLSGFVPNPPSPNDLATICYTSGTTGNPKGVLLSHANFVAVASACLETVVDLEQTDKHFSYLPLAHIFERTMHVALYKCGASVIFSSGDIRTLKNELAVAQPTIFIAVPRVLQKFHDGIMAKVKEADAMKQNVFNMALDQKLEGLKSNVTTRPQWDAMVFGPTKQKLGLQNVRFLVTGGASISAKLKNFFRCLLAVPVLEGYGQTECCAAMTLTSPQDHSTSGHVGVPIPCCKVRLEDVPEMGYFSSDNKHGEEEKVLGRGEICVKGAGVMAGYYKNAPATKSAIDADGWLHTGDIGAWTANGQLKVIDRKKDLFKLSQGEYVSPEKVENILLSCDSIAQVFVWGVDSESYPVAVAIPDPIAAKAAKSPAELLQTILAEIRKTSKAASLMGFETVKKCMLDTTPFGVENNLLTPTMKLRRPQLTAKYKEALLKLYATKMEEVEEEPEAPPVSNMWKNQASLPRLPLPSPEQSMKLFLEVTETLVDSKIFEQTKLKVNQFLKEDAPTLQEKLKAIDDKAAPDSSWFAGFHHDMYMDARYPGYVYKNPSGVAQDTLFTAKGINGQLDRAAHITCATIKFARQVINETLEPDVFKGFPLDMLQYPRMFGCTRIPGVTRDSMFKAENIKEVSHIVVFHTSNYYKVDFKGDIDDISLPKVKEALQACLVEKERRAPVGALTCDNRDVWANNRERLMKLDAKNVEGIKAIDEALFVLCLDENDGVSDYLGNPIEEDELEVSMQAAVHGTPGWRWFDKPCQIIVTKTGQVCMNSEHSWGDGIAMMRWGTELVKEVQNPTYKLEEKVVALDPAALLAKAMANPDIMAIMMNPKARPIAAKIKANPAVLANPAAAFSAELAADPELAQMFAKVMPALAALKPKAPKPYQVSTVDWILDEGLDVAIEAAAGAAQKLAASTKRDLLTFNNYGAKFLKDNGLSPDAVMQQALQLAYMKRHGKCVSAYCVAQHMAFKAGRNERMRGNTVSSSKFIKTAVEGSASAKEQYELLKEACKRHSSLTQQCVMGMGFDRHLYALNAISNGMGKVDPAALMAKAMANPDIMAIMMNPKARPIAAKIKANPAVLANPAAAFSAELAADPELAQMFAKVMPALAALKPKARPQPPIFSDEAFIALMTDTLCSSMLAGKFTAATMASPAFGDFVNESGAEDAAEGKKGKYFIPYATFDDEVKFFVNGFEPEDMSAFRKCLEESLMLIKMIIENGNGGGRGGGEEKKKVGKIDPAALMAKAMANPKIMAVMQNPKARPIAAKIVADPSVLLNPEKAFAAELQDPELGKLFAEIAPALAELTGRGEVVEEKKVVVEEKPAEKVVVKSDFVVGDVVKSAWGNGKVDEVRDDGTVVYTLKNWELAFGSKVKCYLNPNSVQKKAAAVVVGDEVKSAWGDGKVEEVRDDGTVCYTLSNWELAFGSKVKCYLNPNSVQKV
ncbi:hypothetical protein TL16_g02692 [Triparma laevis f. inornata]|uniref:Uncharacterized protein n=1 Tax=Triparma laevis f. inornata TaxID=1714386 RepID=A0A9W7DXL1_9STRA|nr:hypothetical protein TL16_g02692 [Triparma laevis f. inornata]